MSSQVKIKLVKSGIGRPKDQRDTLRGLGLKKMNQERVLEDTPAVRGMMNKVTHLVKEIV